MNDCGITIDDIKRIAPFSQGSTEIFLTGLWSSRKPVHIDKTSPCRQACPVGNDISRAFYEDYQQRLADWLCQLSDELFA